METVLEGIPFSVDRARLKSALGAPPDAYSSLRTEEMAREAEAAGAPSAVYRISRLARPRADGVDIDGISFDGTLLAENLDGQKTVFPFIATCGTHLEEWAGSFCDMLDRYRADVIANLALESAVDSLKTLITERHGAGPLSMMNPGSLATWPLDEQRKLFALLGRSAARIGVALTDSLVMRPLKSISGIFFTSSEGFVSCERCPRAACGLRRAPFNGCAAGTGAAATG